MAHSEKDMKNYAKLMKAADAYADERDAFDKSPYYRTLLKFVEAGAMHRAVTLFKEKFYTQAGNDWRRRKAEVGL